MKTASLIRQLYKRYPKSIAKIYHDYVGVMVGKLKEETNSIFLVLDFDETILDEALEFNPDLIITHHPFFYGSKVQILKEYEQKRRVNDVLLKHNIPLMSMHTNFDGGTPGMNDALAKALDLEGIYASKEEVCMRIGYLKEEMDINDFAKYAKEKLHAEYAGLIAAGKRTIKKVGIIGGGGSSDFRIAKKEGCDIYISGDVSHHVRRDIILEKFNYLDMPHEIESIFMEALKEELLKINPELKIKTINHEKQMKII